MKFVILAAILFMNGCTSTQVEYCIDQSQTIASTNRTVINGVEQTVTQQQTRANRVACGYVLQSTNEGKDENLHL